MARLPSPFPGAALVACLVVSVAPVAAAPVAPVAVYDVRPTGDGVIDTDTEVTYVAGWRPFGVEVDLRASTGSELCLRASSPNGDEGSRTLDCRIVDGPGGNDTVRFDVDSWPANRTGSRRLTAVLTPANRSLGPVRAAQELQVVAADGDLDDDGLGNRDELDRGTRLRVADTDGDGLADGAEVNVHGTDPTAADTDEDGLADGLETGEHGSNPTAPDTDGDGLADGPEVSTHGTDPTEPDTDGDGLPDGTEVRTYGSNPTAADTDGDGLADGTEVNVHGTGVTVADTDGDGLADGREVRVGTNPTEPDTDGDGLADGAELDRGTNPNRPDTDGDGVPDGQEVDAGTDPTGGGWLGGLSLPAPLSMLALAGGALLGAGAVAVALAGWLAGRGEENPEPPAEEPVGDRARVRRLLEANGGRLRQAEVVERTGWSKSKASRVLSRMAEDEQVRKISVGRENLITLPEAVPDGADPPFDE